MHVASRAGPTLRSELFKKSGTSKDISRGCKNTSLACNYSVASHRGRDLSLEVNASGALVTKGDYILPPARWGHGGGKSK